MAHSIIIIDIIINVMVIVIDVIIITTINVAGNTFFCTTDFKLNDNGIFFIDSQGNDGRIISSKIIKRLQVV